MYMFSDMYIDMCSGVSDAEARRVGTRAVTFCKECTRQQSEFL